MGGKNQILDHQNKFEIISSKLKFLQLRYVRMSAL